jgi:excisionase family DNA binding protein
MSQDVTQAPLAVNDGLSASPAQEATADRADRLLRASEVQRELGVSRATAYRLISDGTIPAYRFGGRRGRRTMVRVSYRDLCEWRAAHRVEASEIADQAKEVSVRNNA